jgi:hypothetical protein
VPRGGSDEVLREHSESCGEGSACATLPAQAHAGRDTLARVNPTWPKFRPSLPRGQQGREVRARIQEEAGKGRKRRSAEVRAREQSRQWDRQRQDIHPAEVIERLASVEASIPQVAILPPAVPDADPDRPVRTLRIRTLPEEEPLP